MRPQLVQQYIDPFVRRTPTKIAVDDGRQQCTYRELDILSNKLARFLAKKGVTRQGRVAFCLQRSVSCLTALLGILKADAVYVPLDHKAPAERTQKILADCTPQALICDPSTLARFASGPDGGCQELPIICLGDKGGHPDSQNIFFLENVRACRQEQLIYRNSDTDTAYILYTSGSTGQPKGVMISHRNINCYIDWAVDFLDIGANDKILGTAPFHFDMSTFDIHCTLRAGATLCIAQDNLLLFPEMLLRYMEEKQVTIWKGVSSLLSYIDRSGVLSEHRISSVRKILFGGEALPAKYLIRWMESFPGKYFYNAYGPTEATGISLCYLVPEVPKNSSEKIPIGKPCTDTFVFLVNEDNTPAKPGDIGELCIAGSCLSSGYLNDLTKTADAFVDNPFSGAGGTIMYKTGDLARMLPDGNYEFIDRKDNQVKVLGYRIELCEIENAMLSIGEVKDAAVQLMQSAHEGLTELVAFYESEETIAAPRIFQGLEALLPRYMLPRRLIQVECIPRNDRGKVCRSSLNALLPAVC